MSKVLLPTTAGLDDFVRILCGWLFLAIVASWPVPSHATGSDASQVTQTGLTPKAWSLEPPQARPESKLGRVVANWRFSRSDDVDFDGWPDNWQRQTDQNHPPYVPIKLVANDPDLLALTVDIDSKMLRWWQGIQAKFPALPALPPSVADLAAGRYLRVELDGGWAMVQSPMLEVEPLYRYRLDLSVKTESLVHDHAYAELIFFDAKNQPLTLYETNRLTGTNRWRHIRSQLAAVPKDATSMAVRLILRPMKSTGEADIRGAVGFDDVSIVRLPEMSVSTDNRLGIYPTGEQPEVTVRVRGIELESTNIHFVVRDAYRKIVAKQTGKFDTAAPPLDKPIVVASSDSKSGKDGASIPLGIDAVANWRLPELKPGFYSIDCLLGNIDAPLLETETTFAILVHLPMAASTSPYGWTMPKSIAEGIDQKRLPEWLHRLGVRAFKLPCWFDPKDKAQIDDAAWMAGRLQDKNIRTIGVLDKPPPSVLAKIDERERREPHAANLFRDSSVWQPLLEPIMTRLSLKVRTWQLGADDDFSFLGRPMLKESIKDIANNLQGFGQPIGVAISWPWLEPLPPPDTQSWAATQLSASTSLAADELDAYLESIVKPNQGTLQTKSETWVTIDPLESSRYDLDVRIADLVMRMTAVRGHRVQSTFVTNPASRSNGLLREDWRPGELLLPWRTTATLLADVTRLGTLSMPAGSENVILSNDNRMLLVVWNPIPTYEKVYLGDSVRQIDVWGNVKVPRQKILDGKPVHEIEVGPVPTFLVDVDPVIVVFRMSTRLTKETIDSLLGRTQSVTVEFSNPTREPLNGEVRMNIPTDWKVDTRPQAFDLAPGGTSTHSFDVSLRNSAKMGEAQLEFDFLLQSRPAKRFSVTRKIHVGPEGLDVQINTRVVNDELAVYVTMTNQTSVETQYDCQIFPPGTREYQRQQINLPANTTVRRVFTWPNGEELIGKRITLRANEQGGERMLNQVVIVTP